LPAIPSDPSQCNDIQSLDWLDNDTDGWITYPGSLSLQERVVAEWHRVAGPGAPVKPVAQSLCFDLAERSDAPPEPIHLGYRLGLRHLESLLTDLRRIGVRPVALNLRLSRRVVREVLEKLLPLARGEPL
jgi:hypothetical protein